MVKMKMRIEKSRKIANVQGKTTSFGGSWWVLHLSCGNSVHTISTFDALGKQSVNFNFVLAKTVKNQLHNEKPVKFTDLGRQVNLRELQDATQGSWDVNQGCFGILMDPTDGWNTKILMSIFFQVALPELFCRTGWPEPWRWIDEC